MNRSLSIALLLRCFLVSGMSVQPAAGDPGAPYYAVQDILVGTTLNNSRDTDWQPEEGLALEVTAIAVLDGDRIAVAIRKGEVWFLDKVSGDPAEITYTRHAAGLDEPLGLLRQGDDLLVTQRSEVTRLQDRNRDGVADRYLTAAKGWNVSGNYHGYVYGPAVDKDGNLWVTTNLDMGGGAANDIPWRGWGLRIRPDGSVEPMCAGMRSPCGLGANAAGDLFFTDQQGDWIPTNSLHHLRKGAYYGNLQGMAPAGLPGSPLEPLRTKVNGDPYPLALEKLPQLVPPAVWFPYGKMGRSRTGITLDSTRGKFGPFAGQLFIGEFTNNKVGRVFLEKVGGEYQGACFPFLDGFPCAVMQTALRADGTMFVGMTNRGWSSLGAAAYGLQRVSWTGKIPFEAREMRAAPDGFELVFTTPVDAATAGAPDSYRLSSYTYPLSSRYGGDEIQRRDLEISRAQVSADGLRVRLAVDGLRPFFVHELHYPGVRSRSGAKPWHHRAYYTLNRIPGQPRP